MDHHSSRSTISQCLHAVHAAVVLCSALSGCPAAAAERGLERGLDERAVIRVRQDDCRSAFCARTWASGTFIGQARRQIWILTCAHGWDTQLPMQVEVAANRWTTCRIAHIDRRLDLALIPLTWPDPVACYRLAAAQAGPAVRDRVSVVGYPGGGRERRRNTDVKSISEDTMRLDATFRSGESGGAVIAGGRLIGVISATDYVDGYAVSHAAIRRFVSESLGEIPGVSETAPPAAAHNGDGDSDSDDDQAPPPPVEKRPAPQPKPAVSPISGTQKPPPPPEPDMEPVPDPISAREPARPATIPNPAKVQPTIQNPANPAKVSSPPPPPSPSPETFAAPLPTDDRLSVLTELVGSGVSLARTLGIIGATGGLGGLAIAGVPLLLKLFRRRQTQPAVAVARPPEERQVIIAPEVHVQRVESDLYAQAQVWAQKELLKKHANAAPFVDLMESLRKQYLSAPRLAPYAPAGQVASPAQGV